MNKEAVQRLREPAAWVLLVAAGLQLLAGIVLLFLGKTLGGKFTTRALNETLGAGTVVSIALAALLVVAVLLVAWGETPTPQARLIVMGALGVFAVAALFGVISWLAGLVASGELVKISAGVKLAAFLYGAAKVAVLGIGGWFTWTVFQGIQPARPQGGQVPQGYPDYGYQQGQQPYGQAGYAQQPPVESQPQGYEQQAYDQQQYQQQQPQYQQPQYDQAQYDQQQYDQQQYQQGGYQQGQQPGQPGQPGGYSQGGQSLEDESAGEWTRAYGDEQQQYGQSPEQQAQQPPPGYGQQGYGQQHEQRPDNGGDWYREGRPPQ